MTDEHVGLLDVAPQEVPDVGLGGAMLGDEISADLNVRTVQDRTVRGQSLDQGDQARHLRVVNLISISITNDKKLAGNVGAIRVMCRAM